MFANFVDLCVLVGTVEYVVHDLQDVGKLIRAEGAEYSLGAPSRPCLLIIAPALCAWDCMFRYRDWVMLLFNSAERSSISNESDTSDEHS